MIEEIKNVPHPILGVLLAILIATIRVIYDKEETSAMRISLESLLCGALALTAGTAIKALGLDSNWTLFVSGVIGFMGSQTIRAYADVLIKTKINDKTDN